LRQTRVISWVVWLLAGSFFMLDYFIRISPSVITNELMSTFHVNAFALGGLSGVFYYAYVLMQVPVGLLVDRFGPRRPLIIAVAVCTAGIILFGVSQNISELYLSRILTGLSGAFSFVGTLKIIHLYFPRRYFAILAGITQALGMIGATVGDAPMSLLMNHFGWRQITLAMGAIFLLLLIAIIVFIREKSQVVQLRRDEQPFNVVQGLKCITHNSQTWINSIYIGFLYGPTAAFAGLWGVPYFTLFFKESTTMAATQIGTIFIGLAIGCPIYGWISNRMGKRIPIMRLSAIMCFILIVVIIFGHSLIPSQHIPQAVIYTVLFLYGFFNSGLIPSYAVATESSPHELSGIALGLTNMASLIIGSLLLPVIGRIVDYTWSGHMYENHPLYTVGDFQIALLILPLCFIIALIASFFIKETYCVSVVPH